MASRRVRKLWGQDFHIVEQGLEEADVVAFISHITKNKEAGITEEARRKAEDEAARVVAGAEQQGRKVLDEAVKKAGAESKKLGRRRSRATRPQGTRRGREEGRG